jgi:hypothetical protein
LCPCLENGHHSSPAVGDVAAADQEDGNGHQQYGSHCYETQGIVGHGETALLLAANATRDGEIAAAETLWFQWDLEWFT